MNKDKLIDIRQRVASMPKFVSVIPDAKTVIEQKRINQANEKRNEILQMNDEEFAEELKKNMPLHETVKGLRDAIRNTYRDATAFLVASSSLNADYTTISFETTGDERKISEVICETLQRDKRAREIFNDALVLYAKCAPKSQAEVCITIFEDLIKDFKAMCSDRERLTMIEAEIKRLRKCGRTDLMRDKIDEKNRIIESIEEKKRQEEELKRQAEEQKRLEEEQRRKVEELKAKRLEWLKQARAALAEKREKAKRQKNQRPQPNFAKMAKQKRQQIAARQAERKKKKSSSSADDCVKSCSQMLNNH